uniref:Uncharacterized protein n=1 Tax=Chrysotila carterae TaxID=13221 RepID=A0A7S4BCQ5_CHRCT
MPDSIRRTPLITSLLSRSAPQPHPAFLSPAQTVSVRAPSSLLVQTPPLFVLRLNMPFASRADVCDMLASTCPQWRSHCRAHSSKKPWQAKKLALKNHKAALAAAEQDHGAAATRTPKPPTPTARTRPGTRPSFSLSSSDLALSQPNIFNMPNYLPNHPPALARPPDLSYFHQPPTPAIPTPQSYLVATPQSAAPSARQRHARAQAHAPASSPLSDGLPRVRVSLPRVRARDGLPPLPPPVDARPSSAAEEQRLYAVTHRALIESGLRADYSSSTNAPPHGFSM